MNTTPQPLSEEDALRAYARMLHHLSVDLLLQLSLDANYEAIKESSAKWES
jgi:hypothetical protein